LTFGQFKNVVPNDVTLWLQDRQGDCIDNGELQYLSDKYDGLRVIRVFPERYPAISSMGITVEVEGNL